MEAIVRKKIESVEQYISQNLGDCGLTLSLAGEGYYCRFDSGVAGYLVMKRSELRAARGVKRLSKKTIEQEKNFYRGLISGLNDWLNRSIYELCINGDYIDGYMYSISELAERIKLALTEAQAEVA